MQADEEEKNEFKFLSISNSNHILMFQNFFYIAPSPSPLYIYENPIWFQLCDERWDEKISFSIQISFFSFSSSREEVE